MNGSNEACLAAPLAQRLAQLGDKARERRLGHERRWPEPLVKLALRDCAGARFDEHAQQFVGLGRQMYRLQIFAGQQLPALVVQRKRPEGDRSGHTQKIPQKLPNGSEDS